MTWKFWNEYLLRHLILDLIPHPKLPYFAIATCPLAQGMASVHASLLASDTSQYTPGKYKNMVIKVPKNLKKADNFSRVLDVVASYAIQGWEKRIV